MKLSELVDIEKLRELCESYTKINGAVTAILDLDGEILIATGWKDLCTRFHRVNESTARRCRESDTILAARLENGHSYNIYRCKNGLVDVAVPIMIRGEHVANFFTGQFFTEAPDRDFFLGQAEEFGFDKDSYLDALNEVPIFSDDTIESMMKFFTLLVGMIGEMGLARKELEEVNLELRGVIAEREQVEMSLRESEERHRKLALELKTILNASPVGISFINNRKVVWANDAHDLILGYQVGTTHLLDTMEFYPDRDSYERIGEKAYSVFCKGGTYSQDALMKKKDGSLFWCSIAGHSISPENMQDGTIWIIQDISERKRAEEQMENLTRRLQLATSSAHLGVWDWNVKEKSIVWDDRMIELYGGANSFDAWMNVVHPEDKETVLAECQAALNGEKEFDTHFRVIHPDGTVKHIKANGLVIFGADGTAERMIGISGDVTDLVRSEEEKAKLESQLQQAQKMESVGRLAGGVAHDFNNMLSVILGHAELGITRLDPTHPVCVDLIQIRKAAERSADLTRQLLAFARKQAVVPKVIDLNETVAGMLSLLQRLITEDIHLAWQPASDLWLVKIDPSQVDQIMANLCVNARDAMESTGRITIETENCTLDADYCAVRLDAVPGDYVRLSVSDDGCGMDKETLSHIFEPFFTTKELGKGTGLGLSTVYGAVKQNSGFISTYSEPGHGTNFSIYLPRYEGDNIEAPAEGATLSVPHGQETILLVEDEVAILEITTAMLEKQGYRVLAASTPGEAIQLATENMGEIHMLMTDVIMPEMNGRDLGKKLLSIYPHMKMLFMSGYTADVIAHRGVLDERVHFIQKPFTLTNMAAKVREVLSS